MWTVVKATVLIVALIHDTAVHIHIYIYIYVYLQRAPRQDSDVSVDSLSSSSVYIQLSRYRQTKHANHA